jgi:hypothetical protein
MMHSGRIRHGQACPHSPGQKNVHFFCYRARRTVLFLLLLETSVLVSEQIKKFVSIWDESILKYAIFLVVQFLNFFVQAFFNKFLTTFVS